MKSNIRTSLYAALAVLSGGAFAATPLAASAPVVVERGPSHRVWQRTTYVQTPSGKRLPRVSRYVELATGMHYWEDGQWKESRAEIELAPDGAVARRGSHKVSFAPNINTRGSIALETEDGKHFRSHILGLAYTDEACGQSRMIATIKDSIGELTPPNQVLYPDAFTDYRADVRYTYTKAGFEQDIILREQLDSPATYGMNPETTRLEVYTEFVEAPTPIAVQTVVVAEGTDPRIAQTLQEPDLVDEQLDFGAMRMGPGHAFPLEARPQMRDEATPTGKRGSRREGRQLLIEKVEYFQIAPQLDQLPKSAAVAAPNARRC